MLQAITELVRRLRQGSARNALILANGGFLSYQHAICISTQPRRNQRAYPDSRALPSGSTGSIPPIDLEAEGKAQVEVSLSVSHLHSQSRVSDVLISSQTYTVEFGRDGSPQKAYVVGRLIGSNHRFLANHGNQVTLNRLASFSEEPIGKIGSVMPDPSGEKGQRRNLFYIDSDLKL